MPFVFFLVILVYIFLIIKFLQGIQKKKYICFPLSSKLVTLVSFGVYHSTLPSSSSKHSSLRSMLSLPLAASLPAALDELPEPLQSTGTAGSSQTVADCHTHFTSNFVAQEEQTLRVSTFSLAFLMREGGGKLTGAQTDPWCFERLPPSLLLWFGQGPQQPLHHLMFICC